jgi:hypothetical protein
VAFIELNDTISAFIKTWAKGPKRRGAWPFLTRAYTYLALLSEDILYAEEELARHAMSVMYENIETWAKTYSKVYKNFKPSHVVTKTDLQDKGSWFVPEVPGAIMATSGTTTGDRFEYLRWDTALQDIEVVNHYRMILKEFNLPVKPKVLYFLMNHTKGQQEVVKIYPESPTFTEQHGAVKAEVHFVEKNQTYIENRDKFFETLIDHLYVNPVDVILTNGQYVNSLLHYARKWGVNKPLATLLSNTCERMLPEDHKNLTEEGIVRHVCDHMRCWDGGAGFFTCRYGIYHLMDNLSHTYQGENNMLISTDYFSFASPFVNYWNGDYVDIELAYKRCSCGRLYRPFRFLQSRPFTVKGRNIAEWRQRMREENIRGIKQVICNRSYIEVISNRTFSEEEKEKLRGIIGLSVVFTVQI